MIGLSVSMCIKDIIEHKVELVDVIGIIGGTNIKTLEGLESLADGYAKTYWRKDPVVGKGLLFWFYFTGLLYQPRIYDVEPPNIAGGWWVNYMSEVKYDSCRL